MVWCFNMVLKFLNRHRISLLLASQVVRSCRAWHFSIDNFFTQNCVLFVDNRFSFAKVTERMSQACKTVKLYICARRQL
jgi:hypothetical protein